MQLQQFEATVSVKCDLSGSDYSLESSFDVTIE